MWRRYILLGMTALGAFGQEGAWQADIRSANEAQAGRRYALAAEKFDAALKLAESERGQETGMLQALRGLANVARLQGNLSDSQRFLSRALAPARITTGAESLEVSDLMTELASVQRAQGLRDLAIGTLVAGIEIREKHPEIAREALARDLTLLGVLQLAAEDSTAIQTLERALLSWDAAVAPDDVRILTVLDALGGAYRDAAEYGKAEPLYLRALSLRETAAGVDSADLIATLDSLSYVYFGQKKYAEAEPVYKRLLATWESSAGGEHPMVALTLEKMGVFYAAQERYAEAEPLFDRSMTIRTKALLQSVNHKGRTQIVQKKLNDAEDLYRNAVALADAFKIQDEVIDPMLRIYADVLKQSGKTKEAKAIDDRIRAALIKRADREGTRKPVPVKQ